MLTILLIMLWGLILVGISECIAFGLICEFFVFVFGAASVWVLRNWTAHVYDAQWIWEDIMYEMGGKVSSVVVVRGPEI